MRSWKIQSHAGPTNGTIHNILLVAWFQIDVETFERDGKEGTLDKIRKDRGYSYDDKLVIDKNLPDYVNKVSVKTFTEIIEYVALLHSVSVYTSKSKYLGCLKVN